MISRILLLLFGVGLGISALADDVVPPPEAVGVPGTAEFSGRDIYERYSARPARTTQWVRACGTLVTTVTIPRVPRVVFSWGGRLPEPDLCRAVVRDLVSPILDDARAAR